MKSKNVVIPWNRGMFTFPHWWQAYLVRVLMSRWSGWTNWDYLSDEEKNKKVRIRYRKRA